MTFVIKDLSLGYAQHRVLNQVSLQLPRGQLMGILGANGAGKSSFLAALAGDLSPIAGQVCLDGVNVADLSSQALARQRAVLPQNPAATLNYAAFNVTVKQILALGLYAFEAIDPESIERLIVQACVLMQLDETLRDQPMSQLSGGQQQRVHIARVLVQALAGLHRHHTSWLLLDEPLANLDPLHQQCCLSALHQLVREHDLGVVVVMHDLNLAAQWCDQALLFADQRVLAAGPVTDVLNESLLERVFGMRFSVLTVRHGSFTRFVVLPNR